MNTRHILLAFAAFLSALQFPASAKVVEPIQTIAGDVTYYNSPYGYLEEMVPSPAYRIETRKFNVSDLEMPEVKVAIICGNAPNYEVGYPFPKEYNIPEYVELDGEIYPTGGIGRCFANSSVESVGIPDGVMSIEAEAFLDAGELKKLTLPASLRSIGCDAFKGTASLGEIYMRSVIPPVCEIKENGKLRTIGLENNGEEIKSDTPFEGFTGIVYVPKGSEWLYSQHPVFKKLRRLPYQPEFSTPSGVDPAVTGMFTLGYSGTFSLTVTGGSKLPMRMSIPSEIKSTDYALGVRMDLNYKNFPNYIVTSITNSAFQNYAEATALTLPQFVEFIGSRSFMNFGTIKSIVIPNSVRYIGSLAFANNLKLEKVALNFYDDDDFKVLCAPDAFEGISEDAVLYVDRNTKAIDLTQAPWNKFKEVRDITEY